MNEMDEILESLDDKTPKKKPSNWQLWASLYFSEFIFVLLDAGSAVMVGVITKIWYYGVIVFFSGVIPLWLYTKTYTRALASKAQKNAAMLGGIVAVGSVIVVAVFVAIINFAAAQLSGDAVAWMETGLGISLIFLLAVHGFVNAYYFFTDEEVKENDKTDRIIARGDRSVKRIGVAQTVANAKQREVKARKVLEKNFTPEIVSRILSMMADDDGDGIPNFIDFKDNRKFAKQTAPVPTLQKQYTIDELLEHVGKSKGEVVGLLKSYGLTDPNKAYKELRSYGMLPDDLSHGNFARLFNENFAPKDKGQK